MTKIFFIAASYKNHTYDYYYYRIYIFYEEDKTKRLTNEFNKHHIIIRNVIINNFITSSHVKVWQKSTAADSLDNNWYFYWSYTIYMYLISGFKHGFNSGRCHLSWQTDRQVCNDTVMNRMSIIGIEMAKSFLENF